MNTTILKSAGAILAGCIFIFVLSVATDTVLEKTGLMKIEPFDFNPWWLIITVIISRCIYTIAGAYLTARLAPGRPMRHAIILGIISVAINIGGAITMWGKTPHWFPIVLCALPLPCAWAGGKLRR